MTETTSTTAVTKRKTTTATPPPTAGASMLSTVTGVSDWHPCSMNDYV